MAGQVPAPHWRRTAWIHNGTLRRDESNGPEGPIIIRCRGIKGAFHRVIGIGAGEVQRCIHWPRNLPIRAGEIQDQITALDGQFQANGDGVFKAIGGDFIFHHAIRGSGNRIAHGAFGTGEDFASQRIQIINAFFRHDARQAFFGLFISRELRTDIAERFIRLAQIGFHEGNHILILHATL